MKIRLSLLLLIMIVFGTLTGCKSTKTQSSNSSSVLSQTSIESSSITLSNTPSGSVVSEKASSTIISKSVSSKSVSSSQSNINTEGMLIVNNKIQLLEEKGQITVGNYIYKNCHIKIKGYDYSTSTDSMHEYIGGIFRSDLNGKTTELIYNIGRNKDFYFVKAKNSKIFVKSTGWKPLSEGFCSFPAVINTENNKVTVFNDDIASSCISDDNNTYFIGEKGLYNYNFSQDKFTKENSYPALKFKIDMSYYPPNLEKISNNEITLKITNPGNESEIFLYKYNLKTKTWILS